MTPAQTDTHTEPSVYPNITGIYGGKIPARFFATRRTTEGWTPATVHLAGAHIGAVDGELGGQTTGASQHLDASGCYLVPGFIDVHIHGAHGHDLMDGDPQALAAIARFLVQHGVTAFLPTTMSAPHPQIEAALEGAARWLQSPVSGARVLGVHLEGPYLSPDYPGAQPPTALRPPDFDEFRSYLDRGVIRLVTLAPELDGAASLVREARRRNIAVAMGHSAATYEQAQTGFDWGISQATHTYNAMVGLHHRTPGALGATLTDDRVYAQLIADNIHVHPAAMSILARCKTPARTILISDAMRATGLGPGRYDLGGLPVQVEGDTCRLESGALAGSLLTLDAGLRNFMAATGLPLAEAWVCTSHTPACALGIDDQFGAIEPGYMADLVLLDADCRVVATLLGGKVVYLRDPARLQTGP